MDSAHIKINIASLGTLPKKITDVTGSISKGATSVTKMTEKMQTAVNKLNPKNPVSKATFGGLEKAAGAINTGANKIAGTAEKLNTLGKDIAKKIEPVSDFASKLNGAIADLENCKAVLGTSSLMVNAVVNSVTGHFHPRQNEAVFQQFDNQWDSWAKTVDGIFHSFSPDDQMNVLEALAKEHFGNNIFALGSAIKNESAGIFGGIADFEDALHRFRGSFRNPAEAINKIESGVKGIIRATERVSNSLNNMVKTYQKGIGNEATGNPILSYLSNLHDTKAVAAINKTLSAGTGVLTLSSDASALGAALKSKDPKAIYSAGKNTYDDIRALSKKLKGGEAALGKMPYQSSSAQSPTGGTGGKPAAQKQNTPEQNSDNDDSQGKTDSYVCSKAKIKCSYGDRISTLTVLPSRTIWLTGEPQANISDHISMQNIAPFGKCHTTAYPATGSATAANHGKLTPMPCVPNTPFPWMNGKDDVILKGQPALLKSSTCRCAYGGVISLTFDGQSDGTGTDVPLQPAVPKTELDIAAKQQLSPEELLDGLQMALDAAGMVPGFGAVPDLLNACISACRGDWAGAGLSLFAAIPGIGDAAGAAKIMKNGAKIASKTKKAQKATSDIENIAAVRAKKQAKASSNIDEVAAARAKREAKVHREKLVEQGIPEGKVKRLETKQNVILKKEATTGRTIEINQPTSVSRVETTKATSVNPFEKVTPVTQSKQVGSSTSYGAGNRNWDMASRGQRSIHKEEPLFKMKDLDPEKKVIRLDDVKKAKGADVIQTKIDKGEKRPDFGI